jgi:transposase
VSHEQPVYASDLTNEQWALIEALIPVYRWGRPRTLSMRRVVNAILSVGDGLWRYCPELRITTASTSFQRGAQGCLGQCRVAEQVRTEAGRKRNPVRPP